jgi:serine/threonine-protein kinase
LIVSKGPEPVTIPNVIDETRDTAKRMLEELGLVVEFSSRFNAFPGATVTATDPAVGTSVGKGSTVTLRLQFSISD